MVKEILLLGDPRLYEISSPIEQSELPGLSAIVADLHDTLLAFPGLLVNVRRYRRCRIRYRDMDWNEQAMELEGDLSELLQHEYDHLDGILATMRALDSKSFFMRGK